MILLSFNEWELDEIIEIEESKKSTGLIRAVGAVTEIVIELGLVEFLWSVFALNHTRWWQSLVIIFICNRLALYVNYRNTHTNTHTHGHYREREREIRRTHLQGKLRRVSLWGEEMPPIRWRHASMEWCNQTTTG